MDEQYSRNLSSIVYEGLDEKSGAGLATGPAPLGYKSKLFPNRKGERKIRDPKTMKVLLMLLETYASGRFSYRDVADQLNAQGYLTSTGRGFIGASIRDVLANRFYEGKVVYHRGQPDEALIDGVHKVPEEVKDLWLKCQEIKELRRNTTAGHPRGPAVYFPLSRVLACFHCGSPYYGEAVRKFDKVDLRLSHERRGADRRCNIKPRSQSVSALVNQMGERVIPNLNLGSTWKTRVLAALKPEEPLQQNQGQPERLQRAQENLRKQHQWGDQSDDAYRREREPLDRQLKLLARPAMSQTWNERQSCWPTSRPCGYTQE